jgi:cyclopropane fatty-acyl-phospholipid synthase-like methyltransferase
MLSRSKRGRNLVLRILRDVKREWRLGGIYGLEWGDPDLVEPLQFVRDRYVLPYVKAEQCAVEIGPGGGRWTRYMLGFKRLYVVDYYAELLKELRKNFHKSNMEFIKNNGTDFPGIKERSIDYLFSFGTFVHLEISLIEAYLMNMKPILKPGANVVIHYADKNKIMARLNDGFAENRPEKMRKIVSDAGYTICEEDLTTMWHSSIIRFTM